MGRVGRSPRGYPGFRRDDEGGAGPAGAGGPTRASLPRRRAGRNVRLTTEPNPQHLASRSAVTQPPPCTRVAHSIDGTLSTSTGTMIMRKFLMALSALSLAIPTVAVLPTSKAEARSKRVYRGHDRRYQTRRCRHSSGTTGLVAGGVGGALLGHAVGGGLLGTVAGAGAGALGGRAIDRSMTAKDRCR